VTIFSDSLKAHYATVQLLDPLEATIVKVCSDITAAFKNGNKVLLLGNGGSAADAQHIAAEFVGRYGYGFERRKALPAIALTTDTSILTALVNDAEAAILFSRQVEALAQKGDVVIGISTSGNSSNVLNGIVSAKKAGCTTIGLLGGNGGTLKSEVDTAILVPSNDTPRIQECHILLGHIICDIVERNFAC
jgi:D-sedoheptulose 7-phosphate isomerase